MNNRLSYLDTMNAGRRRRASTSLEEISNSLAELERRIRRSDDDRGFRESARRLANETAYREAEPGYRRTASQFEERPVRDARHAAGGDVAEEMKALRRELQHQMSAGLHREFDALKKDIETALQSSAPVSQAAELGVEFERLSAQIHKLAQQGDDRQLNLLRLEMEQVKNALGKLAREETVQSFDRRWGEFDERWSDIARQVSEVQRGSGDDAALKALAARLDQIGQAVDALPTSVALRSLEDKMRLLSATVDQFAHQQDRIGPEALDAIEERLNEISRAVAASLTAPAPAAFDPQPFERIEARISSLARQLGEAAEDNPVRGLVDQLAALSHRVEDIALRVEMPEQAVARLAGQIDGIASKLEDGPAAPDLSIVLDGLENRFAILSQLLEQRHVDALAHGQDLFRDLERRLEDVSVRIGARDAEGSQETHLLQAMDARFDELAARLERQPAAPADEQSIRALEQRLDTISSRIEASAGAPGVDPGLIQSLESQIADLAKHISTPAAAANEANDLRPRLDKIEQSILEGRQDVVEAARKAAEEAVRGLAASGSDGVLVAGLVEDLKSLEALTRKSDDRNAKTFEAIHDTLLKIVDRLGSVEAAREAAGRQQAAPEPRFGLAKTPPIEPEVDAMPVDEEDIAPKMPPAATLAQAGYRTAATAAAEAAADAIRSDAVAAETQEPSRRSMFGGLTRAFRGRGSVNPAEPVEPVAAEGGAPAADADVPSVELDAPLDPAEANQPLEPGSGAPDLNAIMKRVRDERGQPQRGSETAKADFIAAARRAAQAAAAEAEMMKQNPAAKAKSGGFSLGGLLKNKRKPVLMGVAAVLMALAALQVGKAFRGGDEVAQAPAPEPTAIVSEAIPMANPAPDAEPQPAPIETVVDEAAPEKPIRMAGEPAAPASATTALVEVPDTAVDVATDWLDAPAATSVPLAASQEDAPAETPAAETTPAAPVDEEQALAAIPLDAGPVALREAAAGGDPKAMFEIGERYASGRGADEDMAKAASWYEKAADQGLAPAQYRIGNLYEKGVGVTRDVTKAKTWYQLAAAQGNASAMHNLAVLFAMGADGTTDNESAARWFTQAAELGVKDSQFNLGILTAKGVGVDQDLEEAYKWFALVAKTGDKDAAAKRDEVANALRPEQLENARAAAELWRAKPVEDEANAVEIPESWGESEDTTASVDVAQAVRNIQHILNKNGYQAGTEDGVMGQKTKAAIASFQSDNGMESTGEIDEPLVRALLERR